MKRLSLWTMVGIWLAVGAGPVLALDWLKPQVTVTIPIGTSSVTVHYPFKNSSNNPVRIIEIQTSCGCTVASTRTMDVPAGGTGTIDAIFTAGDHLGRQSKFIYVRADDSPQSMELGLVVLIGGAAVMAPRSGK